ncbi:MAG: hypothetical protein K2X81_01215 [Candidatus Obscuribacterales bacterium]|nr:hypothetical protein [Candidatus Obscuribacterales bacterium]
MRRMQPGRAKEGARKADCSELMTTTLNRMAWGGIHDQLAGGFARYSVDRRWLIPHFEKMLYDNALIPRNYLDAYVITGNGYWLEVARDCLDFVLRELTMPEGGFYCSLDADSEGVEGKYYVWTPEQISEVLGKEDAAFFCDVFDVSVRGNFEHGNSALNFPEGPEACMKRLKLSDAEFWKRVNPLKAKLLESREKRIRPGRDDKMLTSWTSLMISAFVDGYKVIGDKKYLDAATKAASFILDNLMKDGRLLRTYGRGISKLNAYLEDYAYFIQALLDLASCDADYRWLCTAVKLNEQVLAHFWDSESIGFFFTSDDHEELIARTKHFYDGSTPSSSSVSVMNLIRLARLCNKPELLDKAAATIRSYTPYFHKAPDQFSNMLCALDTYLSQPIEVAVVYDSTCAEQARELILEFYRCYIPSAVLAVVDLSLPDKDKLIDACPLLRDRPIQGGKAALYICRNFTCEKPITDKDELKASLAKLLQSAVWERTQAAAGE